MLFYCIKRYRILGGNHRMDWMTTYPFNVKLNEFNEIKGLPKFIGKFVNTFKNWRD